MSISKWFTPVWYTHEKITMSFKTKWGHIKSSHFSWALRVKKLHWKVVQRSVHRSSSSYWAFGRITHIMVVIMVVIMPGYIAKVTIFLCAFPSNLHKHWTSPLFIRARIIILSYMNTLVFFMELNKFEESKMLQRF